MQSSVGRSALLVHSSLQQGQLEEVAYSPLEPGMTALFLRRMRLGEGPTEGWQHLLEINLEEVT